MTFLTHFCIRKNIFFLQTEQATIPLNAALETGEGKLIIEFTGNLNDKMKGVYRSNCKLSDDNDDYFCCTTQFEAFPCWEELVIKSMS